MGATIRYLLDGEAREIAGADPTGTLLEHLRGDLGRTGTKEGCAEGDCGACTVLVGELDGGEVAWRAVNACILFLPMIHGRALMTVESLARDGAPHPVQQAMVDHHGSQCGFCTPGIVMSLAGRAIGAKGAGGAIEEVLAGNLCRCTGYGPIIAAAEATPPEAPPDVARRLAALGDGTTLDLSFEDRLFGVTRRWLAPRSLAELASLAMLYPDAIFVAGATDVGLWVTKQRRSLGTLIFVGDVAELNAIEDGQDILRIGAGVRYVDALPALAALAPDLGAMVRRLGSVQVRNSGTVGGNIANGSPIGDMAPALIAAGARLHLRRGAATRRVALEDFFLAYGRQDRRPGEFVEAVEVPKPPPGTLLFKVFKLSKRFDQDISAVCGAFALAIEDGWVAEARIAFGGMAATPRRALGCEAALIGRPWTAETVETAAAAIEAEFTPISDMRASAEYRTLAAKNLLRKAFIESRAPSAATRVLEFGDG
jgi:xanthine dehydrogenase small subunit